MAKIPIILEPGRADGKLIKTNSVYDDNQEKFLSDKIREIDDNHNTLKDNINTLTKVVNNNESDIENKLETEKTRAINTENNLRETINNITEINKNATTAEVVTVNTLPNTSVSNAQQALNELFKNTTYAGIATPTTNPDTPNASVFYIATIAGSYLNFSNIEVFKGESAILKWNNGIWVKNPFKLMTDFNSVFDVNGTQLTDKLSELEERIGIYNGIYTNGDVIFTNASIPSGSIIKGNITLREKSGAIGVIATDGSRLKTFSAVNVGIGTIVPIDNYVLPNNYGKIEVLPFSTTIKVNIEITSLNVRELNKRISSLEEKKSIDGKNIINGSLTSRKLNDDIIKGITTSSLQENIPETPFDSMTNYQQAYNATRLDWVNEYMENNEFSFQKLIIKVKSGIESIDIYKAEIVNGIFTFSTDNKITIQLSQEMLDQKYGSNVYICEVDWDKNYIPAFKDIYFKWTGIGAIKTGLIDKGSKVSSVLEKNKKIDIAVGIIRDEREYISIAFNKFTDESKNEFLHLNERINEIDPKNKKWEGKKIAFLGDSITYGVGATPIEERYSSKVCNILGATELNYGESGSLMGSFYSRVSGMDSSADAVIVFGGTNDFGHSSKFGTTTKQFGQFTEGKKTTTFYGGLHMLFSALVDKYKDKLIVIVTPLHHGIDIEEPEYVCIKDSNGNYKYYDTDGNWSLTQDAQYASKRLPTNEVIQYNTNTDTGKTQLEYINAIKEVAKYYSLNVIDAYSFSSLQPTLESVSNRDNFKDGLHPNNKGHLKLAKYISRELNKLVE